MRLGVCIDTSWQSHRVIPYEGSIRRHALACIQGQAFGNWVNCVSSLMNYARHLGLSKILMSVSPSLPPDDPM